MRSKAAYIFGAVFIAIGVLGFVPGITNNQMLLGIFHVNSAHNVVHLLSGAVALICAQKSELTARSYFRIFGAVYGLVAILGLSQPHAPIFGFIANNPADTVLHFAIAVTALYLGFYDRFSQRSLRKNSAG